MSGQRTTGKSPTRAFEDGVGDVLRVPLPVSVSEFRGLVDRSSTTCRDRSFVAIDATAIRPDVLALDAIPAGGGRDPSCDLCYHHV